MYDKTTEELKSTTLVGEELLCVQNTRREVGELRSYQKQ